MSKKLSHLTTFNQALLQIYEEQIEQKSLNMQRLRQRSVIKRDFCIFFLLKQKKKRRKS